MKRNASLLFSSTIFLGSALLFCVEPMLGKTLLPTFGGASGVWTTCLAAYQLLLLGGAYYADRAGKATWRGQYLLHIALLFIATVWIGFFASHFHGILSEVSAASRHAELSALLAVFAAIGLPFIVMGAGSSLLQHWSTVVLGKGRETYRLYAISNLGSFVGLLVFPFLLEPFVSTTWQWRFLSIGLLLYGFLFALSGRSLLSNQGLRRASSATQRTASSSHVFLWLYLPALSTALLNSVTTHIAYDVPPIPLTWVLLLSAFLLSFALGFSRLGERLRSFWALLGAMAVLAAIVSMMVKTADSGNRFLVQCTIGLFLLLGCGTFFNSWLCSVRPDSNNGLTRYYLCIALGGAFGGCLSSLVPPMLFRSIAEYPIALAITSATLSLFAITHSALKPILPGGLLKCAEQNSAVCLAGGAIVFSCVIMSLTAPREDTLQAGRSFYGNWRIARDEIILSESKESIPIISFIHGDTAHGYEQADMVYYGPTAYFGHMGGGLSFSLNERYASGQPVRCGIVGMGIGTMAYYGRTGDLIRFFELDGDVADVARNSFSFCKKSSAKIEVVLGDGRKSLERELATLQPRYDILVVDAYNGDSIPYHLVTRQSFSVYKERLLKNGILALHVTNWHVDLLPICKAAAAALQMEILGVTSPSTAMTQSATWVFLSEKPLSKPDLPVSYIDWQSVREVPLPDDELGSILPFLKIFGS